MGIESTPQLRPDQLGMAQTSKAVLNPGICGIADVQIASFSIQPLGYFSGKICPGLFSSKKPPSPQRQVEEAALAACKNGGDQALAQACAGVTISGNIFASNGNDFIGSGLGRGFSGGTMDGPVMG